MKLAPLGLLLLLSCANAKSPIQSVKVLDPTFELVRVFEDPERLAKFAALWERRKEVPKGDRVSREPDLFLDISDESGGCRWAYYSTGDARLVAHKNRPSHTILNVEEFNELLGLAPNETD